MSCLFNFFFVSDYSPFSYPFPKSPFTYDVCPPTEYVTSTPEIESPPVYFEPPSTPPVYYVESATDRAPPPPAPSQPPLPPLTLPPLHLPTPNPPVLSPLEIYPIPLPGTPIIYSPHEAPPPMPFFTPATPVEVQYLPPSPFIVPTPPFPWYPAGVNSQGFTFAPPPPPNVFY